jgi:hypothetical protein
MTPDLSAGGRAMPGWLKGGLLATLVFVACWAGAISYWRGTGPVPSTADLLLFLVGLPVLLLVAVIFGRKLVAAHVESPAATTPSAPTEATRTPVQLAPLAMLGASLRSPHGASAEELGAALADKKARASLDPELVDDDGFPIMTARRADARDEALQEEITEWLGQNGMTDLNFSDEWWRALTLASAVAGELASVAASELISQAEAPPRLQLIPMLPAGWSTGQRQAAGLWLKHTVAQFGWPSAHIALPAQSESGTGELTPSAIFGRLAHDAATVDVPLTAIVVACASHISEETVSRWAARGSLFTSSQPQGAIPGEGAAGLLLTDLRHARSLGGAVFALLNPVEEARRDTSADEVRRADAKLLGELAERALTRSRAGFADVALLVGDTGHRSNRVLELMGHVSAKLPQLDGADDVLRVGLACGNCDTVPFITALALARHHALEGGAPVLTISNEDPYRRLAALIEPHAASHE